MLNLEFYLVQFQNFDLILLVQLHIDFDFTFKET